MWHMRSSIESLLFLVESIARAVGIHPWMFKAETFPQSKKRRS
jgi:hypothetical protein